MKISVLSALAALATGAVVATSAAAQGQAPASPAAPVQPAAAADPTTDQIASWIAGNHGEVQGVDETQGPPQRDGKIHGEFGASVGSGGYKSGYGVATMPIGSRGDVTVGVSDEHLGGGNRGYGSPGYGYGGERRTLAIGIDLTGDHARCDRASPDRTLGDPAWGPSGYGGSPTYRGPQGYGGDAACAVRAPGSEPAR